eukprot:Gregarina_sp_Poly_1__1803@NODE_1468_length_4062_cov_97_329161_g972_i0_p3_GENE_NODE_1468_length_4062_cov_97_329161_g972_i0NODE_1468_length_4062_cov_97_329161_g972_i0_p3_ORF_typecomplete_len140_score22_12_NODE_1468_length_4062_cov_97_329161_g972_i09831402
MGNKASTTLPDQFVVQSKSDFDQQINKLMRTRPTIIKSVVLPPGVDLSDPRLQYGEVVDEKTYSLEPGDIGAWPEDVPFEVDVDRRLVPPCWGKSDLQAHYAVYPNNRFKGSRCGICELTERSKADMLQQASTKARPGV